MWKDPVLTMKRFGVNTTTRLTLVHASILSGLPVALGQVPFLLSLSVMGLLAVVLLYTGLLVLELVEVLLLGVVHLCLLSLSREGALRMYTVLAEGIHGEVGTTVVKPFL
jgi:hypothetical protein